MNLRSTCLENNAYDLDIFISIIVDEDGDANLKNLGIFHLIAFFIRSWHVIMVEFSL